MPVKLHDYVKAQDLSKGTIAGYLSRDKKTFNVWRSTNPAVPAFIYALEGGGQKEKIYSNYPNSPWVAPAGPAAVKGTVSLDPNKDDGARMVDVVEMTSRKMPKRVTGSASKAPLSGGLHAAASAVSGGDRSMTNGSETKGLKQSLRYYMLAAYSLLNVSQEHSYGGLGNYVGALLVSDRGEILAAGLNTGSYRHAEVSMLLSYFRRFPTAKKLPAKSIVFSTLTPCKQCTGYLSAVKANDTVIYFGQSDTGKDGKAGEKIASKISEKLDAPAGRSKDALLADIEGTGGEGVASDASTSGIHKVKIAAGLTSCLASGSIAKQVGKSDTSRAVLKSASDALIHKTLKDRAGGKEDEIKQKVLEHITYWLGTSKMEP